MNKYEQIFKTLSEIDNNIKKYTEEGGVNYASAYGSLIGHIRWILCDMDLTEDQLKVLDNHISNVV